MQNCNRAVVLRHLNRHSHRCRSLCILVATVGTVPRPDIRSVMIVLMEDLIPILMNVVQCQVHPHHLYLHEMNTTIGERMTITQHQHTRVALC